MKKTILSFVKAMSFVVLVAPLVANANSETNTAPQSDAVIVEATAPATVVEETPAVEKKANPVSNVVNNKKQAIKDVVSKIKEVKKSEKADKSNGMPSDKNLKFAIIFGIIGLACMLLGIIVGLGPIYIIGGILLVVALVFLILWAINQ